MDGRGDRGFISIDLKTYEVALEREYAFETRLPTDRAKRFAKDVANMLDIQKCSSVTLLPYHEDNLPSHLFQSYVQL